MLPFETVDSLHLPSILGKPTRVPFLHSFRRHGIRRKHDTSLNILHWSKLWLRAFNSCTSHSVTRTLWTRECALDTAYQGCAVWGSAKSSFSRTFTSWRIWKVREFGQKSNGLSRVRRSLQHASVKIARAFSSVPLFPCSKSNMLNVLYMKYDL